MSVVSLNIILQPMHAAKSQTPFRPEILDTFLIFVISYRSNNFVYFERGVILVLFKLVIALRKGSAKINSLMKSQKQSRVEFQFYSFSLGQKISNSNRPHEHENVFLKY